MQPIKQLCVFNVVYLYNETVGISCSTFFIIQFVISDIYQMQSNYLPFLNIIIGGGLIPKEAKLADCAHA